MRITLVEELALRRMLPSPEARKRIRERAGVSQARVGAEIGVTAQAVAHWEQGARKVSSEYLHPYVAVLAALEAAS